MASQGHFSDFNNVHWSFLGQPRPCEKNAGRVYYSMAKVRSITGGVERTYKLGDCVFVNVEEGSEPWVGQVVDFFSKGKDPQDDDELQVVHDTTIAIRMFVVLRWFYNPKDVEPDTKRSLPPCMREAVVNELYFSDHIEYQGNPLEVIEGRAFPFQTQRELEYARAHHPSGFWEGDRMNIVRHYYGTSSGIPPPMRELERGELEYLMKNHTTSEMYRVAKTARRGNLGPVLKGTGPKRNMYISASKPLISLPKRRIETIEAVGGPGMKPSRRVEKVVAEGGHGLRDRQSERERPPSRLRLKRYIVESEEDSDGDVVMLPQKALHERISAPSTRQTAPRVARRVTSRKSTIVTSCPGARTTTLNGVGQVSAQKGTALESTSHPRTSGEPSIARSKRLPSEFAQLSGLFKQMSFEQQCFYYDKLSMIVDDSLKTMAEQGLSFDMNEQQKAALASMVHRKALGNSAPKR